MHRYLITRNNAKKIKKNSPPSVLLSPSWWTICPLSSLCCCRRTPFFITLWGAPDVLDYTKDINAYMRLLAAKSLE